MGDVVNIKNIEPNHGLVDQLEKLLEQAKSGDILSMAAVLSYEDGCTAQTYALDSRCDHRRILAEIVLLQHDTTVQISLADGDTCLFNSIYEE